MTPVAAAKRRLKFDPQTFLSTIDRGRTIAAFPRKQTIFVQGDSSDAVFYIQTGRVKLSVLSKNGKEATIGILNEVISSEKDALRDSLSACAPPPL